MPENADATTSGDGAEYRQCDDHNDDASDGAGPADGETREAERTERAGPDPVRRADAGTDAEPRQHAGADADVHDGGEAGEGDGASEEGDASDLDERTDDGEVGEDGEAGDSDEVSDSDEAGDDGSYERFSKLDGAEYDRVNELLGEHVAFTAREWAVARLCADFRTKTGVEMKRVGEHLPALVPFVTEPYARQEVYGARRSFERKVREAGATFLYGAFSEYFTAEEVDDVVYEATEVAKFLLEVEGADVDHAAERETEERLQDAIREIHEASAELRYDQCPHCGEELGEEAEPT